jgi:hypothetical protein
MSEKFEPRDLLLSCANCGYEWTENTYSIPALQQEIYDNIKVCPRCGGGHFHLGAELTDSERDMVRVAESGFGHIVPYFRIGGFRGVDDEDTWG